MLLSDDSSIGIDIWSKKYLRFGIVNEGIGICYTRTGRSFFDNSELEAEFLARVNKALCDSDFWLRLNTDWVCLDCELISWSAKAQ
ncbi:MAG: hypothetical protein AAF915_20050 [Cyanobacteria bacterium P01_D01_bin.50]